MAGFFSQVYLPWERSVTHLDFTSSVIQTIAQYLESLPVVPLESGMAVNTEATWYLTPTEHATRMLRILFVSLLMVLCLYFTNAFSIISKNTDRRLKHPRHQLLAMVCFGTYILIAVLKFKRGGTREALWLVMPCHWGLLLTGIWALRPSPFLLNIVLGFHGNFLLATAIPDFANTTFVEKILFFVEHGILDLVPFYTVYMDYIRPSHSLIWGLVMMTGFNLFYGIPVALLGLRWNANYCYLMSPPRSLAGLGLDFVGFAEATVAAHLVLCGGFHAIHGFLSRMYVSFRKSKQQ